MGQAGAAFLFDFGCHPMLHVLVCFLVCDEALKKKTEGEERVFFTLHIQRLSVTEESQGRNASRNHGGMSFTGVVASHGQLPFLSSLGPPA